MPQPIFTVGHSTHAAGHFLGLLTQHGIGVLADVRSLPYSRRNPQFNREALRQTLKADGVGYVYLGEQLSARSADAGCYVAGRLSYPLVAQTAAFQAGLARLIGAAQTHRIALMCAEKDPLDCHRTILVARALEFRACEVVHILADGALETQAQASARLLRRFAPKTRRMQEGDLFLSDDDATDTRIEKAYERQGARMNRERKSV
jgi:uncharacterized protein (DUF488 family)